MQASLRLGLAGSVLLCLFACGAEAGLADSPAPSQGMSAGTALTSELDWRSCGDSQGRDVTCAELLVPLDDDAPDGETVGIALSRIAHDPRELARGTLVFDPGGPGTAGKAMARALLAKGYFDALAPGFDIIGFDPRGVGESGERSCGDAPEPDARRAAWATAEETSDRWGTKGYLARLAREGQRCEGAWGPLFRHMGSNAVVADLERLRQALGEEKLNFLGVDYGALLGASYAHAYPETTGAIVLDAPVSPRADRVAMARASFEQLLALQDSFFTDCAQGRLACPPDPRGLFDAMIASATELGVQRPFAERWAELLSDAEGRELALALLRAQSAGSDPERVLSAAEVAGAAQGIAAARLNVDCTDASAEPPSALEIDALISDFVERSELFAFEALPAAACKAWPATRDPVALPTAFDAPPVLVIGGLHDRRTPFALAREMTAALGNAVLLGSDHYGHGATFGSNDCVQAAVRSFLVGSRLPAYGATCP